MEWQNWWVLPLEFLLLFCCSIPLLYNLSSRIVPKRWFLYLLVLLGWSIDGMTVFLAIHDIWMVWIIPYPFPPFPRSPSKLTPLPFPPFSPFFPFPRPTTFFASNNVRDLGSKFLSRTFELPAQPRKIQFLRTFGVGPFFFFFGSNQRERYFSMEHGRWKVARRSLHQLPQPPPETFDDDNPQPPKINWSP